MSGGRMFGSISMPMLVAIFTLAVMIFGPVGFGPRGPRGPFSK
jgi:hypothetical protein